VPERQQLVVLLHWASLVAAFGFLIWATRDQWFDADEWNLLVRRRLIGSEEFLGIWDPHNKHWVTLPVLAYRLLFTMFGVRTYLPYLLLLLVLHLAVAHLLWCLLLRLRVEGLLATAAAAIFALAGAGWQNVTNGFQITFVGALLFGLGAVLVVHDRDMTPRRYGWVWLLLVASLMCSGLGVTMVAVVTAIVLLRVGIKAAIVTASAPAAAYLLWYAVQGRNAPPGAGEEGLWPALQKAPEFLWRGLTDAVDVETGLAGAGAVLLVLLAAWTLWRADVSDSAWRDATVLALGAVLFLALTALGRSGLGPAAAAASRYEYVTLALLLPLAALAVDRLLGAGSARWVAIGLGFGFLVLVTVSTVARNADADGLREQEQEQRVLATSELVTRDDRFLEAVPVPVFMPDLDAEAIRRLVRDGKLPSRAGVTEADLLTARSYLQLQVSDGGPAADTDSTGIPELVNVKGATATTDPSAPGCVRVEPRSDTPKLGLRFDRAGTATIRNDHGGALVARLADTSSGAIGRPRELPVASNRTETIALSHGGLRIDLDLKDLGTTSLCGIAAL
jgi:hypothetical protein